MFESSDRFPTHYRKVCTACGYSPALVATAFCAECTFAAMAVAAWEPTPPAAAIALFPRPMTWAEALQRLSADLPAEATASVHLNQFASTRGQIEGFTAGHPVRTNTFWSAHVNLRGCEYVSQDGELRAAVEGVLAKVRAELVASEADEREPVPVIDRPPLLTAPTTADETNAASPGERARDAG